MMKINQLIQYTCTALIVMATFGAPVYAVNDMGVPDMGAPDPVVFSNYPSRILGRWVVTNIKQKKVEKTTPESSTSSQKLAASSNGESISYLPVGQEIEVRNDGSRKNAPKDYLGFYPVRLVLLPPFQNDFCRSFWRQFCKGQEAPSQAISIEAYSAATQDGRDPLTGYSLIFNHDHDFIRFEFLGKDKLKITQINQPFTQEITLEKSAKK
jgi:hypothetical protein